MEHTIDDKKLERIKQFRPIDDVFFEVLADDAAFCQEILRVILEDDKLTILEVKMQKDVRNLVGRSVRLDALCTLGNGTLCNVEVQRSNNDNHFKRIRYNASCITASETEPGTLFENVPSIIVVYISEFDILKGQRAAYHIDSVVRETGKILDDGMKTICVNTKAKDGSKIAELMQLFTQTEINEPKFPIFTKRMNEIKHSERGQRKMCEIMEEYAEEYAEERVEETKKEMVQEMLSQDIPVNVVARCAKMDVERILEIQQDMIESGQLQMDERINTRRR